MKTITIEVDEATCISYQGLSTEEKQRFRDEAILCLKKIITDARSAKIKKIVDEIKNEPNAGNINPDILLELLRTDI